MHVVSPRHRWEKARLRLVAGKLKLKLQMETHSLPQRPCLQWDYCHSCVWERCWRLPSMLPGLGGGCKWRMSQELCTFSAR